jgi:signal transduction histidine kinase
VRLIVRDTGPGIAPEHQARIFQRFYRAAPTHSGAASGETRADRMGTGLGLAIVKTVAERHGGRVTLESAPGQGSTFTVWLPVAG